MEIEKKDLMDAIERKLKYLKALEEKLDITSPTAASKVKYIKADRAFCKKVLNFITAVEIALKNIQDENVHLRTQNTVYYKLHDIMESEFQKEFSKKFKIV